MGIEKRLNKAAWVKSAELWGVEEAINTAGNQIIPLNPGAFKLAIPRIEEESAVAGFRGNYEQGDIPSVDFSLDFDGRYDGIERLLACLFGKADAPARQGDPVTAAYLHQLILLDSITGIFGTYAYEKGSMIHVVPSAKVIKASFSLSKGVVKVSIGFKGDQVTDDSTITTLANVTYPDKYNRILFRHGVFKMNDQDGDDFVPGDVINPNDFTIDIERFGFRDDHEGGSNKVLELLEGPELPRITVSMNFARMDAVNELYFADWIDEAEKKMSIVFTGGDILEADGTDTLFDYYYKFQFPRLVIEDVEYPDEETSIPAKIKFEALTCALAPKGMTGITQPVQIDIMNKRTTTALA